MIRRFILFGLTCGLLLSTNHCLLAQAVSARDELLALVPADAGFCLSVQNLREEAESWSRSHWIKTVRASALGQSIEKSPEFDRLVRFEEELRKRFGVNWGKLRDDIFGDAVVLAYWPALPDHPEQEQGLLLVRARRADLLKKLVDALNDHQFKNKELSRLEERQHEGVKYHLRKDQRSEHFLLIDGNLLAFTGKESLVKRIIDQRQAPANKKNVIAQQLNRAGAARALAALWVNPRAFDAELEQRAKNPGPEGQLLQSFLTYWRPLDAIVLSVSDVGDLEIRLAIQARAGDLPAAIQKSFTEPSKPGELWNRFPEGAIMSMAGQLDPARLAECIGDFLTPENRQAVLDALQRKLGPAIKMDLRKDVLPNIGPEWGMFIAAADEPGQFPDMLTALAVKPGSGAVKVDQALLDGVNVLAMIAVLASTDKLAIDRVWQEKVQVNFLTGAKVFPQGVRPAWALKDGYLVFASSPEAVPRFRLRNNAPKAAVNGKVPILMLSTAELAKFLRARREQVIDHLTATTKGLHRDTANRTLEDSLRVMDLIQQVTFLQGSGNGQMTWTLRVRPRSAE